MTSTLARSRSTNTIMPARVNCFGYKEFLHGYSEFGAGNEARTRDLDLGKVALYQLSYARLGVLLIFIKLVIGGPI